MKTGSRFQRILVTGASGFLGHHILPALRRASKAEITPVRSRDFDLRHPDAAHAMLRETRPDAIIHLAAKSGGIIDNKQHPADYFHDNLAINLHTIEAARRHNVRKIVTFMGGCSYPAQARSPIDEAQMWDGFPQIESAGYSVAKKMLLVQSWAYRTQCGLNTVVLIPGNVYGEWDNFNLEQAHVIPALIRKYSEARDRGDASMVAFGTGRPARDFVYAGDVAATIPWFLEHYDNSEPVNISAGRRITIRQLAETIKQATGFQGDIIWDTSQPDGQADKIFSVEKLHGLGLACETSLEEGLRKTVRWFQEAREKGDVRL